MDRPFTLSEGVDSWNTIIFLYRSALKEVSTKVEILNDELNIPHGINKYGADGMPAETGFVPEDIFLARVDEIADNAIADACTGSNPRIPNHDEMVALLKACYYDTEVDF